MENEETQEPAADLEALRAELQEARTKAETAEQQLAEIRESAKQARTKRILQTVSVEVDRHNLPGFEALAASIMPTLSSDLEEPVAAKELEQQIRSLAPGLFREQGGNIRPRPVNIAGKPPATKPTSAL